MSNYIERYWRDARPEDAIREPPMVARFRYEDSENWEYDLLAGWDRTDDCRWRSQLDSFDYCQVYDAPDPGEGWRLIDVDIDEPQEGDEWLVAKHIWMSRFDCRRPFATITYFYRRRIEQPEGEPRYEPFRWEDREQLRGRWVTWKHEDGTTIETQISHLSEHRREGFWFKSRNPVWLLENATFLDTGEPVGRRVE